MVRYQLLKLKKRNATKSERIIGEMLKCNRIKFLTKVVIANREFDFLIKGKYVLEIGNHPQDSEKNKMILEKGYHLQQITNKEVIENRIKLEKFLINWINS